MKQMAKILVWLLILTAVTAFGQDNLLQSYPPSVIKTSPVAGDLLVDSTSVKQISVTFSKDMKDNSWSWCTSSTDSAPEFSGSPKYLDDKRTCVINVNLKPNHTYAVWFNTQNHVNFKDTDGNSAVPYLLVFHTK